jgi:hypothetical protein
MSLVLQLLMTVLFLLVNTPNDESFTTPADTKMMRLLVKQQINTLDEIEALQDCIWRRPNRRFYQKQPRAPQPPTKVILAMLL